VQSGENEIEARGGSAVLVPRGTPHTYWNAGPGRLRYLLIMTANIFSLIQGIHALKERTPATLQELFREHDSEIL
jgi:oxalate decarboxylase/phosphoglucose isomerase-like protein (cupin superfamily)